MTQSPNTLSSKSLYTATAIASFSRQNTQYSDFPYQFLSFQQDDKIVVTRELSSGSQQASFIFGYCAQSPSIQGWFPSSFICQDEHQLTYFSSPLPDLCRFENRVVPRLIQQLSELIRRQAEKVGIFRMPGNMNVFKQFTDDLNQSMQLQNTDQLDVYDACTIFKYFYKELPQKMIKAHMCPALQKHIQARNYEAAAQILEQIETPEEFINYRFLMDTLYYVTQFSKQNKMAAENIGMFLYAWIIEDAPDSEKLFIQLIEMQPELEFEMNKKFEKMSPDCPLDLVPWREQYGSIEQYQAQVKNEFKSEIATCLRVKKGDQVTVLRQEAGWALCDKNGFVGWVPLDAIE
ncbi:Rho_GAP domain-containing protein [Hexamita inflata]|uniref:Rho GAP domain-containing protein n=1 Tax=Hexamita inflata TaxID=28002 RepID=A0AA86PIC6_9EUKA|nr:Rho GAP domain-containing protein [Hexamita inflata]